MQTACAKAIKTWPDLCDELLLLRGHEDAERSFDPKPEAQRELSSTGVVYQQQPSGPPSSPLTYA